jgi:hypothetical protein
MQRFFLWMVKLTLSLLLYNERHTSSQSTANGRYFFAKTQDA